MIPNIIKIYCKECGNEFEINLNNKRSAKRLFCSELCAKRNIGKNNKGRKHSDEINKKKGRPGELNNFFGKTHTKEKKEQWSKERKGKKLSKEIKLKMSISNSGENNGFFGKKHSSETLLKISHKSLINSAGAKNGMYGKGYKLRGEKNGGWFGGISENPYGIEFNRTLRNKIRERDFYKCAICKEKGHDVHHIDYNKSNNSEQNLITLCHKDHMKTNFNREHWIIFFKNYMDGKFK